MVTQEESRRGFLAVLRSKWILLPLLGLALAGVFVLAWPAAQSSRPGTVKISLMHHGGGRMAMMTVSNASGAPVMIWGPSEVERKEDGSVVVGSMGAMSGKASGMFLRGGMKGRGGGMQQFVMIQLTGTNHGPWRLRVPVSGYGLIGKVESILKKPPGWAVRSSSMLRSFLQRFQRWSVSDWMEEAPPEMPGVYSGFISPSMPQAQVDEMGFKDILRSFNNVYMRWPSNVSELATYAKGYGRTLPKRYEDAMFATGSNNWVDVYFDHGTGYLSQPGMIVPSSPPFAARLASNAWSSRLAMASNVPMSGRASVSNIWASQRVMESNMWASRAAMESNMLASRLSSASNIWASRVASAANMEENRTFMFIVQNFQSEYKRGPTNLTELSDFVKTHRQPEIPGRYKEAQFEAGTNVGVKISYRNGTITINGSSSSMAAGGPIVPQTSPPIAPPLPSIPARPTRSPLPPPPQSQ